MRRMTTMGFQNVVTEKRIGSTVFRVIAYRKVTDLEFAHTLQAYFQTNRRKTLPKNKIITFYSTFGLF